MHSRSLQLRVVRVVPVDALPVFARHAAEFLRQQLGQILGVAAARQQLQPQQLQFGYGTVVSPLSSVPP